MTRCDFSLQHLIPSRDGEEKIDFGRGMQFVSCDSEKWYKGISESNTEVFLEPVLLQQVVCRLSVDRVQDSNHGSALISWKVLLLLYFFTVTAVVSFIYIMGHIGHGSLHFHCGNSIR